MEQVIRKNLLVAFAAFRSASGLSETAAARLVARDASFFLRLRNPKPTSPTGRTYDSVMDAMVRHWPDGAAKPGCLVDHEAMASVEGRMMKEAGE